MTTRPVIHVYETTSHEFRAYVKDDADKQAWGSSPEIAIRRLISTYNINDFHVHSADAKATGMKKL